MKLVIAEKPSVAISIAKVIEATKKKDGYQMCIRDSTSTMTILGYAVLLGLMMLKSGTLAKSVLNAH